MAYSKLLSSPICMTLGGLNGDIHMCTTSNYQGKISCVEFSIEFAVEHLLISKKKNSVHFDI